MQSDVRGTAYDLQRPKGFLFDLLRTLCLCLGSVVLLLAGGCGYHISIFKPDQQGAISRQFVETPSGFELRPYAGGFTAPSAFAFDTDGTLVVAESGEGGDEPRIIGIHHDGTIFQIYPKGTRIPFNPVITGFRMYGPVGGITVDHGNVYVSHRDAEGKGVITLLHYDGTAKTIVAGLPAQGDYGVTNVVISPGEATNGRLYFGVGSATNSGVVGLDNYAAGWLRRHPKVCDQSYVKPFLTLRGYRFTTINVFNDIFEGTDIATTGPLQAFGSSLRTRIMGAWDDKPNAAIYSCERDGGDLRVEAHGIRYPRGLAFTEYGTLYFTNDGMEMRGTRPVKDDPDCLLKLLAGAWYGWPDYTTDLDPVGGDDHQPGAGMIAKYGYPEIAALIDREASKLPAPPKGQVVGVFKPLSGAAGVVFAPKSGPFGRFLGSAFVALSGDRYPYATGGLKLTHPTGYKVVRVSLDDPHTVEDLVRNTAGGPSSENGKPGLERPIDVKFGPDGALYILDFGQMEMHGNQNARVKVYPGTGKIFRLIPAVATPKVH